MDDVRLRTWVRETLDDYCQRFPEERSLVDRLTALEDRVDTALDLRDRGRLPYHLTSSAIVIDNEQAPLIWHRVLRKWLLPGGHLDPGETPWEGARREAAEEAGVLVVGPAVELQELKPLDMDLHPIPASPSRREPAHFHLDLRFLLGVSLVSRAVPQPTDQVCWVDFVAESGELDRLDLDHSLRRALSKAGELVPREHSDEVDDRPGLPSDRA